MMTTPSPSASPTSKLSLLSCGRLKLKCLRQPILPFRTSCSPFPTLRLRILLVLASLLAPTVRCYLAFWPGVGPTQGYQVPAYGTTPGGMGFHATVPAGGEFEISRHYTALPAGELEKMMMGELHPSKIFQAIPSDSVLYPMVETTEKGGRLEYDPNSNQFTISDAGPAHVREKNLKRLRKTLDHPIKFAHAWSWFVCLTNYRYRDPDLSAAMMRFGWKVVAYSITNEWATVLRVFVELATPLLTGNLLRVKSSFDSVSFAEALGPYKTNSTVQPISAFANTVANPSAILDTTTSSGQSTAAKTAPSKADNPICRRWNKGTCDGIGCRFRHVCLQCKQERPRSCVHSRLRTLATHLPTPEHRPITKDRLFRT